MQYPNLPSWMSQATDLGEIEEEKKKFSSSSISKLDDKQTFYCIPSNMASVRLKHVRVYGLARK